MTVRFRRVETLHLQGGHDQQTHAAGAAAPKRTGMDKVQVRHAEEDGRDVEYKGKRYKITRHRMIETSGGNNRTVATIRDADGNEIEVSSRSLRLPDDELAGETFHLQGQHDQADHGRRGGASKSGTIFDNLEGYDEAKAKERAAEMRAHAERVEPEITANLSRMVGDSKPSDYEPPDRGEGELFGYEFRLKSEAKIAEKIGRVMAEKGMTFDEAADDIKDSVRYTVHFSEDEFGDRAQTVIDDLRANNAAVKVKNTWPPEKGIPYKGVNVQVTREDGLRFEVQFHTPGSQAVKDRMHLLYEEQRVLPADSPRWRALEDEMLSIGNGQRMPRDAERVFRLDRVIVR